MDVLEIHFLSAGAASHEQTTVSVLPGETAPSAGMGWRRQTSIILKSAVKTKETTCRCCCSCDWAPLSSVISLKAPFHGSSSLIPYEKFLFQSPSSPDELLLCSLHACSLSGTHTCAPHIDLESHFQDVLFYLYVRNVQKGQPPLRGAANACDLPTHP